MVNEEGIGKYAEIFRAFTGISGEGTEEKYENLNQDSSFPDRGSKITIARFPCTT
jgi:hypothetical protein